MTTNTIAQRADPQGFSPDPLTDLLRSGAQRLIEQAVEAELAVLLEAYTCDKTGDSRARLVRHGHLPEREVITGIGAVPVKVPRVRDRGDGEEKVRFTSTLLPPYLRKAKSIEELLPWLYLKGITFTKHAPLCLGRTRQDYHPRRFRGLRPTGGPSTIAGNGAISARGGSSTSGRTASTFDHEWLRKNNEFRC